MIPGACGSSAGVAPGSFLWTHNTMHVTLIINQQQYSCGLRDCRINLRLNRKAYRIVVSPEMMY